MNNLINTPCGPVQGFTLRPGVVAFRGIRYASARRWQYPTVTTHWDGVYDASHFGANAISGRPGHRDPTKESFYDHEFRHGLNYTYSEDCQYLNIYAPENAHNAPVIVYIHGGAFMGGSGWDLVFENPHWPDRGVIGVTLNYRLGIFGAVRLPELSAESGHSGNYNLYDQLAALQWVHANIATFGGDPNNITLMGQSAGARSVQMLVGSPACRRLAHRAVMSSGGGRPSTLFDEMPSEEESFAFWTAWKEALGCETLTELRALPAAKILDSIGLLMGRFGFHPTISQISPAFDVADFPDPDAPGSPLGGVLDIPYICGGNTEDIVPGLAMDGRNWSKNRQNSWSYCFARQLPGDEYGAWHSADLWYWFGSLENCWRPFTADDYALRDVMVSYLTNFARTGDPNGPGLPSWPRANETDDTLWLDVPCHMAPAPRPEDQKGLSL